MEQQEKLFEEQRNNLKSVITLQPNKLTLEHEKEKFIQNICNFIEPLNFEALQVMGRPRAEFKDIVKGLLVMSYNGMSYRRAESDFIDMKERELIKTIPKRTKIFLFAISLLKIKVFNFSSFFPFFCY